MRSAELQLDRYDSDKVGWNYLETYDPFLAPWVDQEMTLLELGVHRGGSLQLWRDYFQRGTIVGIDIALPKAFEPGERIRAFEGSQADRGFLTSVARETAPGGFDVIIDDASHVAYLTKTAFWHLFDNHLKPGGLYAIEDWGTGFYRDWRDGKSANLDVYTSPLAFRGPLERVATKFRLKLPWRSHMHGMVGFIKQLVDEQGAHDATRKRVRGEPTRESKFQSITITRSVVFIRKAATRAR